MHCTLDTNTLHCWHSQSQTFLCTKDAWSPCCGEMSVVSLSGMFTEQWMSGTMTEVHPAASHSCQKDFSTRTLLLHAGWVFCRGAQRCAADYLNTVMLSLDMVMTVGTTVMRITNKSVNSATMYSNRTKKDDRNTLKPGPRVASLRLFQQKKPIMPRLLWSWMWQDSWRHIQLSPGLTKKFQIPFFVNGMLE